MELLTQLELVDVTFDGGKATLVFLDEEKGEIREVGFNKQSFDQDTKKFINDAAKAEKVEEWCKEHFNLTFDTLAQAIGERKDVYAYDKFNSLFLIEMVEKATKEDEGQIFETEVTKIEDDGKAIRIQFEWEGKPYESKMQYADYLESRKEWFINPVKQTKQYAKFLEKYDISVENMQEMVGKKIMCEVKMAFDKFPYIEIKKFPKKKK